MIADRVALRVTPAQYRRLLRWGLSRELLNFASGRLPVRRRSCLCYAPSATRLSGGDMASNA